MQCRHYLEKLVHATEKFNNFLIQNLTCPSITSIFIGTLQRRKGEKSTDSSGCSSCECTDCREQGDVCYSCSLYNESSNAGTMRSQTTVKSMSRDLDLTAPDSPLTAWRNNMMKTADHEDKRDMMAGMTASAVPIRKTSQQVPVKVTQQLAKPVSSSTTKSARRQFRESMREIAGAGDSSSDCSSLPRSRAPRSITAVSRDKTRSRMTSGAGSQQRDPSVNMDDGFFKNVDHGVEKSVGPRPVVSAVSGHSKPRLSSNSMKSQGSLSIDSLSGSSSYSQKIAFSETNMQSSLGYLP